MTPRLTVLDRDRAAWLARRSWRRRFVLLAIVDLQGFGRVVVACRTLETRWNDRDGRHQWRLPAGAGRCRR